jgi:hypothetical protein
VIEQEAQDMLRTVLFSAVMAVCTTSFAQGLRISTHVYDVSKSETRTPTQIVSSSLSLIHNGRIYDYVDSADEVIIFDLVEKRFTVLNESRGMSTRITFDEIRHMMDGRQPRTAEYLKELSSTADPTSRKIADSIRFQMNPKFSQTFDPMKGTLVLSSPSFTYRVETRKWNDPMQVEKYLTYADWTAQLNSILHPGSLFPEPRMALNKALRELKDRMPISVELDRRPAEQFRLRADHQLTQKITNDDHQRIARWEDSLTSGSFKEVSFRAYQQATLLSKTP